VKAVARRKGLTLDEYVARVLSAAVESEGLAENADFLKAWEELLLRFRDQGK